MIRIENVETYGWEAAVRGMRNPKNSWPKSDSGWEWVEDESPINPNDPGMMFIVGKQDLALMKFLVKAGSDHSKFMRMIGISMDITAPLYWWKEFDTYKVGTVANSCSTMHKIAEKYFEEEDFSCEHLLSADNIVDPNGNDVNCTTPYEVFCQLLNVMNTCRDEYLRTHDKDWWWQMIQLLPSSYNQRRTVMLNYAVARNQYHARKAHKLDEWHDYCDVLAALPYSELITMEGKK